MSNRKPLFSPPRLLAAVLVVAGLFAGGLTARRAVASDHQDSPEVELNPASDMTDFYAFPGATAGNIVLVMNSSAVPHTRKHAVGVVRSQSLISVQSREQR